ncbi:hypothetical protein [Haliangium sp.]|uniref:hypothetical protein n=1 Tax=Haliangium sp. TaxID=2663208 RepID=UPI003D0AC7A1
MIRRTSIVLLWLALAGPAWAQETIVEGPGYQLGEGTVFHPSVGAGTGLIYNPYYESSNTTTTPVVRLRGAFSLASQGNRPAGELSLLRDDTDDGGERAAPDLDFRLGGVADYQWWAAATGSPNAHRLSGAFDGQVKTTPRGPMSLYAHDTLMRVADPTNYESYSRNLNRVINRLTAGAEFRPGGGAFRFAGQYENLVDVFESADAGFANRIHHRLRARAEWQFLPITRFFVDASWGYFVATGGDCNLLKNESRPLRIELGASSAFTERTSLRVHLGAGRGFYKARPECASSSAPPVDFVSPLFGNYMGLLLGAELGYRYSPLGRISVSYEHDFEDSVQANFYRDHALVGRVVHQLDRILLQLSGDLRVRGYRGLAPGLPDPVSETVLLRLSGKGYYPLRDWLGFMGDATLEGDSGFGYTRLSLQLSAVAAF